MSDVMWLEPAPAWSGAPLAELQPPRLLEITNDNFLPEFLQAMQTVPHYRPDRQIGARIAQNPGNTAAPRRSRIVHTHIQARPTHVGSGFLRFSRRLVRSVAFELSVVGVRE